MKLCVEHPDIVLRESRNDIEEISTEIDRNLQLLFTRRFLLLYNLYQSLE